MKKLLSIVIIMMLPLMLMANDKKYEKAMADAINSLYNGKSIEDYQQAVAVFERIGQAEEDKWLPSYYASLSYLWMLNHVQDKEKMDAILDEAQKHLDKATHVDPENAEIITLQGYIYMMRLTVDPASRGQEYSPKSMRTFNQALQVDANNPRAMLLLGQMKLGTAQYFGNDPSEPCSVIKNAAALLEREKPASNIAPSWGKGMASHFVKNCE